MLLSILDLTPLIEDLIFEIRPKKDGLKHINNYIVEGYQNALTVSNQDSKIKDILIIVGSFVTILLAFFLGSKIMPSKKREKIRKISNMKIS